MKTITNKHEFDRDDLRFIDFFNAHGWVVVRDVLPPTKIQLLQVQYREMKAEYAHDLGVDIADYEREITQWRNLWRRGGAFKNVIFEADGVRDKVQQSMHWQGAKLLHDHIITKPPEAKTSVIPWHQDSMFWPVDHVGCSALTPLENVPIRSGCLAVIDRSHLKGCAPPRDFMQTEKNDFDANATRVLLPLKAGSTLLMHSLCWHRSSANTTAEHRPMHLSLWIHTGAHWRPDLVDWHPVNQYVKSRQGEVLRGEMFPEFGRREHINAPSDTIHTGANASQKELSMFNASEKITAQILNFLGESQPSTLAELTNNDEKRQKIINKIRQRHPQINAQTLDELLRRLWLCAASYQTTKSRNVFNSAFLKWREVVGDDHQTHEN